MVGLYLFTNFSSEATEQIWWNT